MGLRSLSKNIRKMIEKMKHQKEWRTCDRCGAEIKKKEYCVEILLQRMVF
jgi:hypothetical protein